MSSETFIVILVVALSATSACCVMPLKPGAPPPKGILPEGAVVKPASYLKELATGRGKDNTLLIGGHEEFVTEVYGRGLIRGPLSPAGCVYYWLEISHDEPGVSYHILTDVSDNDVYVYLNGVYIKVDQPKRGREPDVVKTYPAGQEPGDWPIPAHNYADVTYRVWYLKPGTKYRVRVQEFGSALPPEEPDGEPKYEVYYHFTFK